MWTGRDMLNTMYVPILLCLLSYRVGLAVRKRPWRIRSFLVNDATAVATSFTGYAITEAQNDILYGTFREFLQRYDQEDDTTILLYRLSSRIASESFAEIRFHCNGSRPVFGIVELRRLLAYSDFAREVLRVSEPMPVDVRVEGWKAYALVPPRWGLIRIVEGQFLIWVHDEAWARARFFDGGKDLGLCGRFMGMSKFVTPCDEFPASKQAALDALGLQGYPAYDKPGILYVIRARLNTDLLQSAAPAIPLLYQIGAADSEESTKPGRWSPAPHFQEGTIPGFTSGLKAELVMNTFRVVASSADELQQAGVSCQALQ